MYFSGLYFLKAQNPRAETVLVVIWTYFQLLQKYLKSEGSYDKIDITLWDDLYRFFWQFWLLKSTS